MALLVTQPANIEMAVGSAAILLAAQPEYFDAEMAPVIHRLNATAVARQMIFLQESDTRQIIGFVSYGFLDGPSAFQWRHRLRSPGIHDLAAVNGECWLIDFSYGSREAFDIMIAAIRDRNGPKAAVIKMHGMPRTYPDYAVAVLK